MAVQRIELARGWDGWLRGGPEPCLLVGVFKVEGPAVSLLGRSVHKLGTVNSFPHTRQIDEELLDVRIPGDTDSGALAVLCLFVEEDGGRDIAALYTDVGTPARLAGFEKASLIPDPLSMAEIMALPPSQPPHAQPICLLRDGCTLGDQIVDDDWIGASVVRLALSASRGDSHWGLRAQSEDRRNDWAVWLHARVDI